MNREEKKRFLEAEIIKAILINLKEKSLDDMTSDEIAKKACVSKRTLYKYFSSKKEMYLGLVLHCFKELAETMQTHLEQITSNDPWDKVACIGEIYFRYCLDNPEEAKIILTFNEMDYITDYDLKVEEIKQYSNVFELSHYIKQYYEFHKIKPSVSIGSLTLYLWAEIQGLLMLLTSKRSWIKDYYNLDEEVLVKEHLMLSRQILCGGKYERKK